MNDSSDLVGRSLHIRGHLRHLRRLYSCCWKEWGEKNESCRLRRTAAKAGTQQDCELVRGARADLASHACQASYVGAKIWQIQVY
jgi:hypothetical protein